MNGCCCDFLRHHEGHRYAVQDDFLADVLRLVERKMRELILMSVEHAALGPERELGS
jgi:hypothetical protein